MTTDTIINMPTITTIREVLNSIEAEYGSDQHIEIKPIANALGSFVIRPVNPNA